MTREVEGECSDPRPPLVDFDDLYDRHSEFVRRSARWFGVVDGAAEDIVQQVFMVVHRRLADLRSSANPRTWLFGILLRVVLQHRRSLRRKNPSHSSPHIDPETLADDERNGPHEWTARAEAARLVRRWIDGLDDDKRKIFVLSELHEMTGKEIAEAIGENQNTVYSRLRAVRLDFEKAAERCRQRDERRLR